MTRVLLVDDDRDVLTAYRTILARVGIEVADSVSSGADALVAERECRPDVVLLDLQMPQMSGADVLRAWRDAGRQVRALVLTSFDDVTHVLEALRAGAAGYILKTAPARQLVRAIDQVLNDEFPLSPQVVRALAGVGEVPRQAPVALTPRELDVLGCLAEGLTNKSIASALVIEESTVKQYLGTLAAKLGARNRTQVVVVALGLGLITLPDVFD